MKVSANYQVGMFRLRRKVKHTWRDLVALKKARARALETFLRADAKRTPEGGRVYSAAVLQMLRNTVDRLDTQVELVAATFDSHSNRLADSRLSRTFGGVWRMSAE